MKHPLSKLADIPETGSRLVEFFGRTVHVYRQGGQPRAVANVCMHFGGPLDYDAADNHFVCPWHNAAFDATTGDCLRGPAPSKSKLMFLSTRIEDDTLYYIWGE